MPRPPLQNGPWIALIACLRLFEQRIKAIDGCRIAIYAADLRPFLLAQCIISCREPAPCINADDFVAIEEFRAASAGSKKQVVIGGNAKTRVEAQLGQENAPHRRGLMGWDSREPIEPQFAPLKAAPAWWDRLLHRRAVGVSRSWRVLNDVAGQPYRWNTRAGSRQCEQYVDIGIAVVPACKRLPWRLLRGGRFSAAGGQRGKATER